MKTERHDSYGELCEVRAEKHADGKPTEIVGRAAVFYDPTDEANTQYVLYDDRDSGGPIVYERISPKAFNKTLSEKQDVRGVFNHEPNFILGRTSAGTMKLEKSLRGLDYRITPGDTSIARDVMIHLERGDVTGSSFAFVVEDDSIEMLDDNQTIIRTINRIKNTYDVGPVTFPAYEGTTAGLRCSVGQETRSRIDEFAKAELERRAAGAVAEKAKIEAEAAAKAKAEADALAAHAERRKQLEGLVNG